MNKDFDFVKAFMWAAIGLSALAMLYIEFFG